MGRDDAPVTMVEFTDYQCPFCRKFETDSFAKLKTEYIDTGKVRFISRDLPSISIPTLPAPPWPRAVPESNINSGKCATP